MRDSGPLRMRRPGNGRNGPGRRTDGTERPPTIWDGPPGETANAAAAGGSAGKNPAKDRRGFRGATGSSGTHLKDYDISDDLSMNLEPLVDYTYVPTLGGNRPVFGFNMSLKF